ncbi:MAG: hypothetical protein ACJ79H_19805, partial [Myxococcales bacterium]
EEQKKLLADARRSLEAKEHELRLLQQRLIAAEGLLAELGARSEQHERRHRDLLLQACRLASELASRGGPSGRRTDGPDTLSGLPPALARLRDDAMVFGLAGSRSLIGWSGNLQDEPPRRYRLGVELRGLTGMLFAVDVEVAGSPGQLALHLLEPSGAVAARSSVALSSVGRGEPCRFEFPSVDVAANAGWTVSLQAVGAASPVRVLELRGRSPFRHRQGPLCGFVLG